jgi:hypothetical protein
MKQFKAPPGIMRFDENDNRIPDPTPELSEEPATRSSDNFEDTIEDQEDVPEPMAQEDSIVETSEKQLCIKE